MRGERGQAEGEQGRGEAEEYADESPVRGGGGLARHARPTAVAKPGIAPMARDRANSTAEATAGWGSAT